MVSAFSKKKKGIRQWSSEACKMRDTAGATSSAIRFSNRAGTPSRHVAVWDLRLRSSLVTPEMLAAISSIGKWGLGLRSDEFIGLLLVNTKTNWFEDSTHLLVAHMASGILSKLCKHEVWYACSKFPKLQTINDRYPYAKIKNWGIKLSNADPLIICTYRIHGITLHSYIEFIYIPYILMFAFGLADQCWVHKQKVVVAKVTVKVLCHWVRHFTIKRERQCWEGNKLVVEVKRASHNGNESGPIRFLRGRCAPRPVFTSWKFYLFYPI